MINQQLTDLILSLTKTEKRYFKIHARTSKTSKTLVKMFEAIENNPDIGKMQLQKELRLNSEENVAVAETRLHALILKNLRNFHSGASQSIELNNLIIEIEILYQKRLFKNCMKLITKAKKLATLQSNHIALLSLLKWESFIEKEEGKYLHRSQEKLKAILESEQKVIRDYSRQTEYKYHTFNLLLLSKNKAIASLNKEISQYDEMIAEGLFDVKPEHTIDDKAYILNFMGMYHMSKGNFPACLNCYIELIDIIEQSPRKNLLKSNEYFLALNNLLLMQAMNKKFGDFSNTLRKIYAQFKNLQAYQALLFNVTRNYELGIYCEIGEAEKGFKILPEITRELKKYGSETYEINKLLFYLNIAIMYLFNQKYKESIYWLNEFLNDYSIKKNDVTSNIYYYGHIINMIVHFEAGNYDSINYLYNESVSNLKKIRPISKFDSTILAFIKASVKNEYEFQKQKDTAFRELKSKLEDIVTNPNESISLHFFDFFAWIDSHLTGQPIAAIIRKKNQSEGA
ncbi:MAG: hypothetical protein KDD41_05445 [Flavobacteriales bacterium]|nr:hypothetical protein [Flavobacteriales bacterium]